jgi:hypothetical protein
VSLFQFTDLIPQLLPIQTIRKEGGDIAYINVLSENFIVVSNADMIQSFSRDPDRLITKSLQSPAFDALREVINNDIIFAALTERYTHSFNHCNEAVHLKFFFSYFNTRKFILFCEHCLNTIVIALFIAKGSVVYLF